MLKVITAIEQGLGVDTKSIVATNEKSFLLLKEIVGRAVIHWHDAPPEIQELTKNLSMHNLADFASLNTTPPEVTFDAQLRKFNKMYGLPVAEYPTIEAEANYQWNREPEPSQYDRIARRLRHLQRILHDEVAEVEDIIQMLESRDAELDILTELADWLGDIQVYCASEMLRFGLPRSKVLTAIMESNFTKLGDDGNPIIRDGKVQKGPNFEAPEPKILNALSAAYKDYLGM